MGCELRAASSRGRKTSAVVLLALAACSEDYVHVLVQTSSNQVTLTPVTVQAEAYGNGSRSDLSYETVFTIPTEGEATLPYTDFNLVFDSREGPVDLRVSLPDTPTLWNGDVRLELPGDGRSISLLLYAGEQPVATTRFAEGDFHSLALFSRGLVMAWPDPAGVALRIERDVDNLSARPQLVVSDSGATRVRIASRPGKSADGPDLFGVTWISSDEHAWLMTQREATAYPPRDLGAAGDAQIACAPQDADYDLAMVVLDGDQAQLTLCAEEGAPVAGPFPVGSSEVRRLRGAAVAPDGSVLIAMQDGARWTVVRVDPDGEVAAESEVEGEIAAMALTADGALALTATISGDPLSLQVGAHYVSDLAPVGQPIPVVSAELLPSGLFSRIAIGDCAIVWPELRSDGSGAVDLRVQDLGTDGSPIGASRFLNGVTEGFHFAPTAACFSPTRAYASFVSITDTAALSGGVKIRQIPPAPSAAD